MYNQNIEYYVLIKINNNIDLDLVNNKVQVIGIFTSWKNAEKKIMFLDKNNSINIPFDNINPKYTIQGPFIINKQYIEKLPVIPENNINLRPSSNPIIIPSKDVFPDNDIFPDDIFKKI